MITGMDDSQQPPSDPIQPFSSSPRAASIAVSAQGTSSEGPSEPLHATPPPKVHAVGVSLPALDSDSDADLPEMSHILMQRKEVERAKELADLKRRALAEQATRRRLNGNEDSDDDLEVVDNMQVVAAEEAGQRRAMKAKHVKPSEGRRRQLLLGGVRQHAVNPGRPTTDSLEQLKALTGPSFTASPGEKYGKRREEKRQINQGSLNKMLTQRVSEENAETIRKKEEEWVKRGGRPSIPLHPENPGPKALQDTWKTYAEKGLRIAEKKDVAEIEEVDETNGSDEDWVPEMRGSASPRQVDDGDAQCEDEVDGGVSEGTSGEVEDDADEEMGEAKSIHPRAPRGVVARSRAILDSDDDDDDENRRILVPGTSFMDVDIVPRQLPVISHRRSSSSLEDRTEDDTDKENNTRLMYDRSEDKENKAVVRHSPLTAVSGFRGASLFSLADGIERSRSVSPGADLGHAHEPSSKETARSPLKELLKHAEDPFASQSESPTSSFATRVQHDSPIAPQPTFTPKILSFDKWDSGFSQFLDDGEQNDENPPAVAQAPALQPGFSQLFESGSLGSAPLKSAAPLDNDEVCPT
jgi:mediator of replication checkpoint protein 1